MEDDNFRDAEDFTGEVALESHKINIFRNSKCIIWGQGKRERSKGDWLSIKCEVGRSAVHGVFEGRVVIR